MRQIANILTEGSFPNNALYNVVSKKTDLIEGLPTMVIGMYFTQKNYSNISFFPKEINSNTFWTYGKREKRYDYETAIEKFNKYVLDSLVKRVRYRYINLLTANEEEKNELNNIIRNCDTVKAYIFNDIAYIYNCLKDDVIGINLRDIDYEGKDRNKFLSMLHKTKNVEIVTLDENLPNDIKTVLHKYNYIIPYLYS